MLIEINFKSTSRIGFITNVDVMNKMIHVLSMLSLIKVTKMTMRDNKLYVYGVE